MFKVFSIATVMKKTAQNEPTYNSAPMLAKFTNKAENNSLKVNSPSLEKIQVPVMKLENENVNHFMHLNMRERIQTITVNMQHNFLKFGKP